MNVIALDIGGTKISGAVITQSGKMVEVKQRLTEAIRGAEHIINSALTL